MHRHSLLSLAALSLVALAGCGDPVGAPDIHGPQLAKGDPGSGSANFGAVVASLAPELRLRVDWTQSGVGNNDVDYSLTADAVAEFGCFNGGGNHPKAANKETIEFPVVLNFTSNPRNGGITDAVTTAEPSAGDFTCPSGQRLRAISVIYSNIFLHDLTHAKSAHATPDPVVGPQ